MLHVHLISNRREQDALFSHKLDLCFFCRMRRTSVACLVLCRHGESTNSRSSKRKRRNRPFSVYGTPALVRWNEVTEFVVSEHNASAGTHWLDTSTAKAACQMRTSHGQQWTSFACFGCPGRRLEKYGTKWPFGRPPSAGGRPNFHFVPYFFYASPRATKACKNSSISDMRLGVRTVPVLFCC